MNDMGNSGSSSKVVTNVAKHVTTKVRIVSYNVLSSHLANPQSYPTYNPQHLDSTYRLRKVLQKLESEIKGTGTTSTTGSSTTAFAGGNGSSASESKVVEDDSNDAKHDSDDSGKNRATIFCLQEVSYDWAGQLHTFFANHQYHVVTGLYGKKFNGYMGVLTAYPINQFKTVHVDVCRLADTYPNQNWPRPPKLPPPTPIQQVSTMLKQSFQYFGVIPKDVPERECHWNSAQRRYNVLLSVILAERNSHGSLEQSPSPPHEFVVSNYHMPCVYYDEKVMVLHSDLCLSRVQDIANKNVIRLHPVETHESPLLLSPISSSPSQPTPPENINLEDDGTNKLEHSSAQVDETSSQPTLRQRVRRPYILAGDFNIKPMDTAYQLLTTGQIRRNDPAYPVPPKYELDNPLWKEWKPLQLEPVRSAYATIASIADGDGNDSDDKNGKQYHSSGTKEPDFTNFSQMGDKPPFIDTLDYIFVSPNNDNNKNDSDDTYSITVKDVIPLSHRDDITDGPYPNAVEPSDHIMIGADLDISFPTTN